MAKPGGVTRRAAMASAVVACAPGAGQGSEPLRAVATTSDLASLLARVGGDHVRIRTLVPAQADPEAFQPRASDLATLAGAALVVRVGLGYDFWLEPLLARLPQAEFRRAAD